MAPTPAAENHVSSLKTFQIACCIAGLLQFCPNCANCPRTPSQSVRPKLKLVGALWAGRHSVSACCLLGSWIAWLEGLLQRSLRNADFKKKAEDFQGGDKQYNSNTDNCSCAVLTPSLWTCSMDMYWNL
eukprot:5800086-Amphidinium_carterae.1